MAKSSKVIINGRSIEKAKIIEEGEKMIKRGATKRKGWGIFLIIFGGLAIIGAPIAFMQGTIKGIGEMIGGIAGSIVLIGLGIMLIFKSKSYPSKANAYDLGHKRLCKTITDPSKVVVSRKTVNEYDVERPDGKYYVIVTKVTYEDGHSKMEKDERLVRQNR